MRALRLLVALGLALGVSLASPPASAMDCPHCPGDPDGEGGEFGAELCATCHVHHNGFGALLDPVRGGTLKDVLNKAARRRLSLTDVAHVINQIANALALLGGTAQIGQLDLANQTQALQAAIARANAGTNVANSFTGGSTILNNAGSPLGGLIGAGIGLFG